MDFEITNNLNAVMPAVQPAVRADAPAAPATTKPKETAQPEAKTTQDISLDLLGQPERQSEKPLGERDVIKAINEANRKLISTRSELQLSVHKQTRLISVKVIDADTKKVIREIPPEKTLDMLAKMWEMAGILVDEKR